MRIGVGLSLPGVAVRQRLLTVVVPITTIVHDADSISNSNPGVVDASYFPTYYAQQTTGLTTFQNRAQPSRTVGGAAYAAEGADTGTPTGNTLLDHRSEDIAYAPQLLTTMIGSNDLGTFATQGYINRLITWAGPIKAAGIKIAYSPPPPYRQTSPNATYTTFTNNRNTLLSTCRNPAVWGQWADYYMPVGEHPDFLDSSQDAINFGDGVHPTGPASTATTGQGKYYAIFKICVDTIRDATRATSTTMYNAAWLASETGLATSATITRRFIVSGLSHTGLALTGGNALSVTNGAQIRRGGGSYAASLTGWLYNGDVIDLQLTTSSSASTAVTTVLTVGTESRTLTYTTQAAVAPVTYTHGGFVDDQNYAPAGQTHTLSISPTVSGILVMGVKRTAASISGITVAGTTATKRGPSTTGAAGYGDPFDIWTVPVTAGTQTIVVTNATASAQTVIGWGVIQGADPTPIQAVNKAVANESAPHLTDQFTVPTAGLAIAFYGLYGGTTAPSGTGVTSSSGSTLIATGYLVNASQSEGNGMIMASRPAGTNVTTSFEAPFGSNARGAVVFKAAGT